jgi:hypothetical protein
VTATCRAFGERRAGSRAGCRAVLGAVLALGLSMPAPAMEGYSEDSVKAAFIYRFAGYVDYPRRLDSAPTFNVAVLGSSEIVLRLQTLVVDRTLHNRPVRVRKISAVQEAGDAQILYIGADHRADLRSQLSSLSRKGILIVTDEEHGLDLGSTINLLMVDRRVRFEVSTEAARRAGLSISSELLSVAARVQGGRTMSTAETAR